MKAVSLGRVKRGEQRFLCKKLACTLSAEACVKRQALARATDHRFTACRACPEGERIARQVSLEQRSRPCRHPSCRRPPIEHLDVCAWHAKAAGFRAGGRP